MLPTGTGRRQQVSRALYSHGSATMPERSEVYHHKQAGHSQNDR